MTGAQKTYPPGVDRVEPYVARVSAAGGRVVVPALDAQPAGRLAIVEAPGGATFGLWEAAERPAHNASTKRALGL